MVKTDSVLKLKKVCVFLIKLTIMSNMNKTSAKFQRDQNKIVGGVALTKYSLIASEMSKNN